MKFKKNFKLIDKYVTFGLLIKIYILIKRWNYFFLYIKQFTFTKKFNNKNIVFYNYKYNYLSELSDKYSSDKAGNIQYGIFKIFFLVCFQVGFNISWIDVCKVLC